MREILLVADHTAYQAGEFATMRRVLKHWDKDHPQVRSSAGNGPADSRVIGYAGKKRGLNNLRGPR